MSEHEHPGAPEHEQLVDSRSFRPVEVMAGTSVTLRVTDELLATGGVVDGPDLEPMSLTDQRELPVSSGGTAQRVVPSGEDVGPDAFRFVLPVDALPDDAAVGDLLGLSWDGEALTVELVDEPDDSAVEAAAAVLRSTFETLRHHRGPDEPTLEVFDLVVAARMDHQLFDVPLLPVTELLAAAGLSTLGGFVAESDHDWAAWQQERLQASVVWLLAEEHGLDQDEAMALLFLLGAVDAELAALGLADAPAEEVGPPAPDDRMESLLLACTNPRVANALALESAYDDPGQVPGLRALADRLMTVARGRQKAVVHHLLACAAEAVGEAEEAASQARRAVQADPQHGPSAWLATRYASLRGRAGDALRHLTAAYDVPPGDVLGDLLRQYMRPGPTDAPRNAPCPCGSGRKHKVCCEPHNGWPVAERTRWLLLKARDHVSSEVHAEELYDLVDVLLGDLGDDERERTSEGLGGNAFVQGLLLWEGGLFEEFLDVHAPLLPADELEMGRDWLDASLELWEVTEVRPDEGLSLLGLYRGESVDVREQALTRTAHVGQTFLARVLDAGSHNELPSVWPVDLRLREYLLTEVLPDEPDHFGWAAAMAPRRPTLTNRDGHELVHHTVTYDLPVTADTAAGVLDSLFGPGDEDGWAWVDDDVLRGELHLDVDGRLVAVTNSDLRRDALALSLQDAFDDGLVEVSDDVTALDELLDAARGTAEAAADRPGEDLPSEVHDAVAAQMRETERRWVAEPVPALGGLTPREALEDPTRRGDLLALLDEFDRMPAPPGAYTMDVDNLRRLLGLDTR